MPVVELGPERCDALLKFFAELPEGDLTFIKEEVTDPETVRSWAADTSPGGRWVSVEDDEVTGYVAVRPLPGWSDHVGEVRLVVSPRAGAAGSGGSWPAAPSWRRSRPACRSWSSRWWPSRARRWPCSPTSASAARPCCATTSATAGASSATSWCWPTTCPTRGRGWTPWESPRSSVHPPAELTVRRPDRRRPPGGGSSPPTPASGGHG